MENQWTLEIEKLRKQVAEQSKDAERYRWLRSQNWYDDTLSVTRSGDIRIGTYCLSLERLDAEIDKAIVETAIARAKE